MMIFLIRTNLHFFDLRGKEHDETRVKAIFDSVVLVQSDSTKKKTKVILAVLFLTCTIQQDFFG